MKREKIRKLAIYLILVEVSSNDFDSNSTIISKILEQPEDDGLLSESIAQDVEILSKKGHLSSFLVESYLLNGNRQK